MLRISKLTDYGTVVLARLAAMPERRLTAGHLAQLTHLAVPTVSKLLKQLHRHGLVESTRGLHGGYRLARAPELISAAHILDALEGPVALTECAQHPNQCSIEQSCGVGRAWQQVNLAIRRTLHDITLLELSGLAGQPVQFRALDRAQRNAPQVANAKPPGTP
jgi:FeS assembly SUF system regulator